MEFLYERYERLKVSVDSYGVALVTINRPEKLNAIDVKTLTELKTIWSDLDADSAVRITVITGAGDRAFSAGGDLGEAFAKEQLAGDDYFVNVVDEMQGALDLTNNIVNSSKPIIAAINGGAVGAGLVVALLCDITIMAEEAKLLDGHTPIGLTAGDHACMIWPLLCGMAKSKYYLLTSDAIDGREAERLGLVSQVVPRSELMPTAMSLAHRLASGPQYALRMTKRALNQWLRLGGIVSFDYSLALEMINYFSGDYKEGLRAFRAKEKPAFPSASVPESTLS
jgi:enoyl-CoA hydratase